MKRILEPMLRYQAWANRALLETVAAADAPTMAASLRLMRHVLEVEEVFALRLADDRSGMRALPGPVLQDDDVAGIGSRLAWYDTWFLSYLARMDEAELVRPVAFTFLDGDKGFMSPMEILTHLVLHGGYHRGEAGRILVGEGALPPWDTFAVFLHATEPGRRVQGAEIPG